MVTVTDTRGRVGTRDVTFTVLPYAAPAISVDLERMATNSVSGTVSDSGIYIRFGLDTEVSPLTVGGVNKNTASLKVEYRALGSTGAWTADGTARTRVVPADPADVMSAVTLSAEASREYRFTLTDKFSSAVLLATMAASILIHLNGADGIGVRKKHARGAIDALGDGYFSGKVYSGGITAASALVTAGELTSAKVAASYSTLPATGDPGEMRMTTDTKSVYMWDGVRWAMTNVGVVPHARAVTPDITRSSTQTSAFTWNTRDLFGGMTYSNGLFAVPAGGDGLYQVQASLRTTNEAANVFIRFYINGSQYAYNITSGGQQGLTAVTQFRLVGGDTVEARIFPFSGSAALGDLGFSMTRIGSY